MVVSVFYEVAFIILAPLVISIAIEAKIPYLRLGMTMVAAATMAHSIFPPQPGPTALVDAYGADMGMVYILGIGRSRTFCYCSRYYITENVA